MFKKITLGFGLCCGLAVLNASSAAVIDFETIPGGSPSDQLSITDQYLTDFGVTFSLEDVNGTPLDDTLKLEKTGSGDAGHGFWNAANSSYDIEATGHEGELGDYFLRFGTVTFARTPGPVLVVTYATPVGAASAQIWDIDAAPNNADGFEAWTVSARDNMGSVIDTIVSPNGIDESSPTSLNAKPWTWSFSHASNDISSITIAFSGTSSIVGLAFDNFSPASSVVPLPAAAPLFGGALLGLLRFRRRTRRR